MTSTQSYVFASTKLWNIEAFMAVRRQLPGRWTLITDKNDLSSDLLVRTTPRYVFFPHWNWIVPDAILQTHECVCFHMTDVPYGRGGSPLQNLIARGHTDTRLTALRMTPDLDAGPVYRKTDLSLEGSAREIFNRGAAKVIELMRWIVENEPEPKPQSGEPTLFARRTPAQSILPETGNLDILYDHIRMLDADGYPPAFVTHGGVQIRFTGAVRDGDRLTAHADFTPFPSRMD